MQNPLTTIFHSQWLDDIGIRKKLILFTIIPIIAMLFFAFSEISNKQQLYLKNKDIYNFLTLIDKLDKLVFEMQRERGISLGLIEAKATFFKDKIDEERELTDIALQDYLDSLKKINNDFLSGEKRKEFVEHKKMLAQLSMIRADVDAENFDHTGEKYSHLNSQTITLIRHLRQLANDNEMIRMGNAYINLLWLRERAGQERAALIWVFASRHINADDFRKLVSFSESQKTLQQNYAYTAPKVYRRLLQEILSRPNNQKVASYRQSAINKVTRNEIINELLSLIGYGGLIHNIKNYVIRGGAVELERAHHFEKEVKNVLTRFKKLPSLNQKDLSHLIVIEDTLNQYFNFIDKITILLKQGKSVQEIDAVVKVDDAPALQAISSLRKGLAGKNATIWWRISTNHIDQIKEASDQVIIDMMKKSEINIQSAKQSLWIYIFATLAVLLATLFVEALLARRLVKELENISHNMRIMFTERRLNQPLLVSGKDEIGIMAKTFNQLMHERQKFEAELRLSSEVFANISEAIMIANADRQIEMINPAFIKVSGFSEEKVLGKMLLCLRENSADKETESQIWHQLFHDSQWEGEMWHKQPNDTKYLAHLNISVVRNKKGVITHYICMFTDITQRKQYEEEIWHQANFDALTNLPNRKMCIERLSENLKNAGRLNTQIAVLFIDLDRFKLINDTLGHKAGDELLIEIAKRLRSSVRETDIVSRLGGDEFVIVLTNITNVSNISSISKKILTVLSKPVLLEDNAETFTSGSIGVALYPQDGQDVITLMKQADTAMYQSKKMGRNNVVFFKEEMNKAVTQQMTMEQELRNALTNKEFCLYYQPIMDLSTGRISGAEALIRWHHPTQGLVYPDKFIGVAEDSGLIVPLGSWVIRTAVQQTLEWNKSSNQVLKISINISSRQCVDNGKHIIKILKTALQNTQLKPDMLQIEITESLLMKDSSEIIDSLRQIREIGIGISLDDFGTGYSSLSYLKNFPISALKVDRFFVQDAMINKKDAQLVQAMVTLSKGLEIDVISEGIEDAEQLAFLKKLGCEFGQGFYFSYPLTAEDFTCYLRKNSVIQ